LAGPIDPRLIKRASATKGFLGAVGVVGVAQSFLVLAQAAILSRSIAHVFYTKNLDGVARDAGLLVLVFLVRGVLTWLTSLLAQRTSAAVKSQLRTDIMAARLKVPLSARTPTATLISVVTKGLDDLDGYFNKFLPQLLLAVSVPVVIGIAVGISDLESLIVVIITIPLIPIFMILIGWITSERIERRWAVQTKLANHFADLVAGLPTLQVFGRAHAQLKSLGKTEDSNRQETLSTLRLAFLSAFVLELLATLSVAMIAVFIGFRVVYGDLDLQTALYVLILAPEVYLPIRMVGSHFHDSTNGITAANAAFTIIEEAEEHGASSSTGVRVPDLSTEPLVLQGVTYAYPLPPAPKKRKKRRSTGQGSDPMGFTSGEPEQDVEEEPVAPIEPPLALAPLTLTVAPGELVALAGSSGGGKSTALGLVMGFLKPTAGQILVGDTPLSELDMDAWHRQLAWVGQDPGMINGTVGDNVALGCPGISDAVMRAALDRVGAHTIGLDHSVGDDGEGLSAGERRRVAMARALIRIEQGGAKMLVLDEPTAGLDVATESEAIATVRKLGVSGLIVSHRQPVLDMADQIIHIYPPEDSLERGFEADPAAGASVSSSTAVPEGVRA
jgi:ATP-binding cassette subfamily C protein CydCD